MQGNFSKFNKRGEEEIIRYSRVRSEGSNNTVLLFHPKNYIFKEPTILVIVFLNKSHFCGEWDPHSMGLGRRGSSADKLKLLLKWLGVRLFYVGRFQSREGEVFEFEYVSIQYSIYRWNMIIVLCRHCTGEILNGKLYFLCSA